MGNLRYFFLLSITYLSAFKKSYLELEILWVLDQWPLQIATFLWLSFRLLREILESQWCERFTTSAPSIWRFSPSFRTQRFFFAFLQSGFLVRIFSDSRKNVRMTSKKNLIKVENHSKSLILQRYERIYFKLK